MLIHAWKCVCHVQFLTGHACYVPSFVLACSQTRFVVGMAPGKESHCHLKIWLL